MKRVRLLTVLFGAAALMAVTSGIGGSGSSGERPQQQCVPVGLPTGLEVVFGRFAREANADALRDALINLGFQHAEVIPRCDEYRVVVRGIEDFDAGVELQSEARRAHFEATIECVGGNEDANQLEAVFGHRRNRAEALQLVSRAGSVGFVGLELEPDPCGGFEVMVEGFSSRSEADDFVNEAKTAGFEVVIEKS